MIDPNSRHDRELKVAEEFFALSRTATSPFTRDYCRRIAECYLSSQARIEGIEPDRWPGVLTGAR
jgi:hypothetical protein